MVTIRITIKGYLWSWLCWCCFFNTSFSLHFLLSLHLRISASCDVMVLHNKSILIVVVLVIFLKCLNGCMHAQKWSLRAMFIVTLFSFCAEILRFTLLEKRPSCVLWIVRWFISFLFFCKIGLFGIICFSDLHGNCITWIFFNSLSSFSGRLQAVGKAVGWTGIWFLVQLV